MSLELGVELEFSKATDDEKRRRISSKPSSRVAQTLATAIRRRFVKDGHGRGGRGYKYSSKTDPEFDNKGISPRYPKTSGGDASASGAVWFKSTAAFHQRQGVKPGSFNVSGGMWSGLKVKAGRGALILFRGRSEGQGMTATKGKAHKSEPHWRVMKSSGKVKAKPKKISNALKAGTILKSLRINVLEPTSDEVQAVGDGVSAAIISVRKAIGVGPNAARVDWNKSDLMQLTGGGTKGRRLKRAILDALTRR